MKLHTIKPPVAYRPTDANLTVLPEQRHPSQMVYSRPELDAAMPTIPDEREGQTMPPVLRGAPL